MKSPEEVWNLFLGNINKAFNDIKEQFQSFLINEMLNANDDRMELIRYARNITNSLLWQNHIMKMYDSKNKLFMEFLKKYQRKQYFGNEKHLVKYFQKNMMELGAIILSQFEYIYTSTNSAKYIPVQKWYETFEKGIEVNYSEYSYLSWERVICKLKKEKPLEFPCLNDILQSVETLEKSLPVKEVAFLKSLQLID